MECDHSTSTLPEECDRVPTSVHALELALENMPVGISWARLEDQALVYTNLRFTEMFGYTATDFRDIHDWIDRAYPFDSDRVVARQKWSRYLDHPASVKITVDPFEVSVRTRSGGLRTVVVGGVILPDSGWALATFVDISAQKRTERSLQAVGRLALETQQIFRLLIDHSAEMMILSPFNGDRRFVSRAVEEITGFTAEEYLNFSGWDFMHPEDRPRAEATVEELKQGTLSHLIRYRTLHKDGNHRWVEATVTGYVEPGSDRLGGYVATVRDLTEQKEREDQLAAENLHLHEAAFRDDLTGIANRRRFNEAFRLEGLRQTRSKHDLSLLLIDVDCFKQYNDTYGHLAGDQCLQKIAQVTTQLLRRESDLLARFGGEEFIALLPMTDMPGAMLLADSIRYAIASLQLPHHSSPHKVVTLSVGVASWAAGEQLDRESLVRRADIALYRAKEAGRNRTCAADADAPRESRSTAQGVPGERRRVAREEVTKA